MTDVKDIVGLKVHEDDNVATVFAEGIKKDLHLNVRDQKGDIQVVTLLDDVPYGHKVAVKPIKNGSPIIKYGEKIGAATCDIKLGDYVHVHNLDSQRSRGDKNN